MIRYTLKCDQGHETESWFADSDAFDTLKAAGHVTCAVCGSKNVEKSLMAPRVRSSKKEKALQAAQSEAETKIAEMRRHVEENSEYVGVSFAQEARAMHDGDSPSARSMAKPSSMTPKSSSKTACRWHPCPSRRNARRISLRAEDRAKAPSRQVARFGPHGRGRRR